MAASIIDSTSVQYEHIVDRVGAEVNTAYHWYRTTWTMDKGVKVTWKINTDGLVSYVIHSNLYKTRT